VKVQTAHLTGFALDWAVAFCRGYRPDAYMRDVEIRRDARGRVCLLRVPIDRQYVAWSPSTKQEQGGAIIQEKGISVRCIGKNINGFLWGGSDFDGTVEIEGSTQLEAAMRCLVATELGAEVDVPEHLLC
jgi:hypothetical protein